MNIFELSNQAVDQVAVLDPVLATYSGAAGHDHAWPDYSPGGAAARRDLYAGLARDAAACDAPNFDSDLAKRVFLEHCEIEQQNFDSGAHHFGLNNIDSPHQNLRFVYGSQPAETAEHWDAILERLETTEQALEHYRETLEEGRSLGHVVSRRQVETVIEQGVATAGEDSPFDQLRNRLDSSAVANNKSVGARLDGAIDATKAAFASFNDYLSQTYLPHAALKDGVGEERYLDAAQGFLGTRLDARQAYRWGWDEVERLWSEMQEACIKIDADSTPAEVINKLQTDPAYAASSQDDFVEQMKEIQSQALSQLSGTHFDVPEQIRDIDVQVEPAGGASAAHYVGPSEDFSRQGSVWYPIEGKKHFPLFREVTTAYHEGFPGHHLQVGVQMCLGDTLSRFQRTFVWYPGSGEGWALYAERLMQELGYFERPEYEIGLLSSQLLRASRVAIDIGSHLELPIPDDVTFHPGSAWSYDLAVELLTDRALESIADAHSEVVRYLGWPGQAISYKIGEQAILDIRDAHKARPGFDLKTFHSKVLGIGSIGLDLMNEVLDPAR